MALTAITGGESAHSRKYPVKEKKESSDTNVTDTKQARKREDIVELRKEEVTQANRSAQKSAAPGAEQLLGKIDLSA